MPPAVDGADTAGSLVIGKGASSMQGIIQQLRQAFEQAIRTALGVEADPQVTASTSDKFGDYQANAAMSLARELSAAGRKTSPRTVAEQIVGKLQLGGIASEVSIAGPGFINIRLSPDWLAARLAEAAADKRLATWPAERPLRVVLDYSSPNVAKEMHVGHLRPTNIGDALARVIEFQGHDLIRQNHIGDWGTQFGMLVTYLRKIGAGAEAQLADLEAFYKAAKQQYDSDAAFAEESRRNVVRLQSGDGEILALWRRIVDESRRHYQAIYQRMRIGLKAEHERGESFYNPMLPDIVRELLQKGVAVESDGAIVVFVEGFEAPLIIRKRDGGFGYGTTDLAAVRYRTRELRAQWLIYVTDARQIQHFAQFFDAARRAGWTEGVRLDHVPFGTILGPDGTPFKTKEGQSVKLKDLLDEAEQRALLLVQRKTAERSAPISAQEQRAIAAAVGIGAIKYYDLARDRTRDYVFDWDAMLSMDGNTAPYLQYAYARIRSIFRKSGGEPPAGAAIVLPTPFEQALAKHILRLGEIVDLVLRELKPHHLCTYLYDLATRFSAFYENCPVLDSAEPLRSSRLTLCDLTGRTLALGLDLLGIEHPEQM
jgi:arginyl-tRNA synthetase